MEASFPDGGSRTRAFLRIRHRFHRAVVVVTGRRHAFIGILHFNPPVRLVIRERGHELTVVRDLHRRLQHPIRVVTVQHRLLQRVDLLDQPVGLVVIAVGELVAAVPGRLDHAVGPVVGELRLVQRVEHRFDPVGPVIGITGGHWLVRPWLDP